MLYAAGSLPFLLVICQGDIRNAKVFFQMLHFVQIIAFSPEMLCGSKCTMHIYRTNKALLNFSTTFCYVIWQTIVNDARKVQTFSAPSTELPGVDMELSSSLPDMYTEGNVHLKQLHHRQNRAQVTIADAMQSK